MLKGPGLKHGKSHWSVWSSNTRDANGRVSLSPVSEPDSLTRRTTPSIENDTHQDQTDNGDDLDQGEPEFHLSVDLDAQEVGGAYADETDSDPDTCIVRNLSAIPHGTCVSTGLTVVDCGVPVVDDNGTSNHFDWRRALALAPTDRTWSRG